MHSRCLAAFALLALLGVVRASAQDSLRPARLATAPVIDGLLDEAWNDVGSFSAFLQLEPAFGVVPTVRTEVFVAYDAAHLYLAARLWQPRASVRGTAVRRDSAEVVDGDFVTFVLDPLLNGNAAYFFTFNPAGAVSDGILDSSAVWTREWDAAFTHVVSVSDDHWVVEVSVPLSSLIFQSKHVQDWGCLVVRRYAEGQERDLSSLRDPHHPYRIDTFPRLTGLSGLAAATRYTLTPYGYTAHQRRTGAGDRSVVAKAGVDLRLTPTPAVTLLATVRPDYAQLESDAEIINVSDVPTSYPEKRPFFAESSDLYPGLAVNTRNIMDIDAGVKLRQVLPTIRYDATVVRDRQGANWYLGDIRWTNNRSYHVEVIGGLKDLKSRRDYNITTNIRTWFLDKRLTAYTWFGTINGRARGRNEFESVNSVKWLSRTVDAGVWNQVKSTLYNPNVVGRHALSNEIIVSAWAAKSVIRSDGVLRRVTPNVRLDHHRLYSRSDTASYVWTAQVDTEVHPSDHLGNWLVCLQYQPPTRQRFRYRNTASRLDELVDVDAFGPFALQEQRLARVGFEVRSDVGKRISARLALDTPPVRGSTSRSLTTGSSWRISASSTVSYDLSSARIKESPWQRASELTIHRVRFEHAAANALNVRAIFQSKGSSATLGDGTDTESSTPIFNVMLVWRRNPASAMFFVYSDSRSSERSSGRIRGANSDRSVAVKVVRSFSF